MRWKYGVSRAGITNDGWLPKTNWPMYAAVAVAIVTGTSVRALTSWSMISTAKSTPPIGVLKVAAIPAPAPAAIRVMRCHTGTRSNWPRVEAKEAPIWMIGPSRPTDPPLPIDSAEASDLITATTGRTTPLL